eukprot:COSAG06_NODE_95_length_24425_cov_882.571035_16_plen_62_part_00
MYNLIKVGGEFFASSASNQRTEIAFYTGTEPPPSTSSSTSAFILPASEMFLATCNCRFRCF